MTDHPRSDLARALVGVAASTVPAAELVPTMAMCLAIAVATERSVEFAARVQSTGGAYSVTVRRLIEAAPEFPAVPA